MPLMLARVLYWALPTCSLRRVAAGLRLAAGKPVGTGNGFDGTNYIAQSDNCQTKICPSQYGSINAKALYIYTCGCKVRLHGRCLIPRRSS